ncbi:hypothetical protein GQ457_16G022680 [Hibiscus cannabinus]
MKLLKIYSVLYHRYARRNFFEGAHTVDPDQVEFLCPVCRRLANSVLPAANGTFHKVGRLPTTSTVGQVHALGSPRTKARVISSTNCCQGGHEVLRISKPIILWDTLKYSLMSTEVAARSGKNSMTANYTLASLYKEFNSSSEFIFSLLLRVVQNLSCSNSLHALQRFRGLQLFAESICSCVSFDNHNTKHKQEDNLLRILEHGDTETLFPDIQFWKRSSDPILARDPFSSLMWVLFCLPCPVISCEEFLLSSMLSLWFRFATASFHIDITYKQENVVMNNVSGQMKQYEVVFFCCGQDEYNIDELGSHHSLIIDVCGILGGFDCARWYFVSNDIDRPCHIKEKIRRLSLPYLRRCALLWKLLKSSAAAPSCDRDTFMESSHVLTDMMDKTEITSVELNEVQEMEKMFRIPPIDVILEDKVSRSFAIKWSHHFQKAHEVCSFQNVFYCNPAVPFKLMTLPHVYQDLFHRFQCCPDCKAVLGEPALCLLCGRLCSASFKTCCSESGRMTHAMTCGADTGVFLLIRRTTISLQIYARQASWPSPYLDAFGEEDIEMRRGKPLYLNEERYAALSYMVI